MQATLGTMGKVRAQARLALRVARGLLHGDKRSAGDAASRALMMTCAQLARSDLGDEDAAARLRAVIEADRPSAGLSVERMAERRDSYASDRAYRLLVAAMLGSAVRPIHPDLQERFALERALGLMPIGEAFARLAKAVPGLADVAREVEKNQTTPVVDCVNRARALVDKNRHRLAARNATGLIITYLRIIAGDTSRGDVSTSYFRLRDQPMVTATTSQAKRD
jgi:hypothetical protein